MFVEGQQTRYRRGRSVRTGGPPVNGDGLSAHSPPVQANYTGDVTPYNKQSELTRINSFISVRFIVCLFVCLLCENNATSCPGFNQRINNVINNLLGFYVAAPLCLRAAKMVT